MAYAPSDVLPGAAAMAGVPGAVPDDATRVGAPRAASRRVVTRRDSDGEGRIPRITRI
ncbi:hypothetical protein [Streptomyces sp. NPDC048172]|uniref:hypothetical protein n=1 Tax=Streptomyces sp. NPDC048172 TaxID=3365505 RepID=UPI003710B7FE